MGELTMGENPLGTCNFFNGRDELHHSENCTFAGGHGKVQRDNSEPHWSWRSVGAVCNGTLHNSAMDCQRCGRDTMVVMELESFTDPGTKVNHGVYNRNPRTIRRPTYACDGQVMVVQLAVTNVSSSLLSRMADVGLVV